MTEQEIRAVIEQVLRQLGQDSPAPPAPAGSGDPLADGKRPVRAGPDRNDPVSGGVSGNVPVADRAEK